MMQVAFVFKDLNYDEVDLIGRCISEQFKAREEFMGYFVKEK